MMKVVVLEEEVALMVVVLMVVVLMMVVLMVWIQFQGWTNMRMSYGNSKMQNVSIIRVVKIV